MSVLEEYDLPFSEIEERVLGWAKEALELRHKAAGDTEGSINGVAPEAPSEVVALLLRIRARSNRVDQLLANVTSAKARATRAKDGAKFAADLATAEATRSYTNSGRRGAFATRSDVDTEATLESIEDLRKAHQAARLLSVCQEAYDLVSQIHWQFESMRKDLRATLHALQFESSLEH